MRLGGIDSNVAALRRAPGVDPAPRVEVRSRAGSAKSDNPEQSGAVRVSLSRDAVDALSRADGQADTESAPAATDSDEALASGELSKSDQEVLRKLEVRDTEVRTHEQAHIAAGGQHVNGGPTYTYQTGPDGRRYAIGGSVNIDSSPVSGDPEATIEKARVVERAALAPAEPSSTDRQVASAARKMAAAARAELADKKADERADEADKTDEASTKSATSSGDVGAERDKKSSDAATRIAGAAPKPDGGTGRFGDKGDEPAPGFLLRQAAKAYAARSR